MIKLGFGTIFFSTLRHYNAGEIDSLRCQWWHSAEDYLCILILGMMQLEVLMERPVYVGCAHSALHLTLADSLVVLQMCSMCKTCIMMTALSQQQPGLGSILTCILVVNLKRCMCVS